MDEDIVVRLPPISRYRIELHIVSIEKAKPKLFQDDWDEIWFENPNPPIRGTGCVVSIRERPDLVLTEDYN